MPTPPADTHLVDQELEDTFPASDPPSMSTPSTATTRNASPELDPGAGWIDLYRVEPDGRDADAGGLPSIAHRVDAGPVCFGTSAALALLHHLVEGDASATRVCIVSARVALDRIDSFAIAPPASEPRRSDENASPLAQRGEAPAHRPGRFRPSTLSPADREVVWDPTHPDAGTLSIVARTVFDLDPRLVRLARGGGVDPTG